MIFLKFLEPSYFFCIILSEVLTENQQERCIGKCLEMPCNFPKKNKSNTKEISFFMKSKFVLRLSYLASEMNRCLEGVHFSIQQRLCILLWSECTSFKYISICFLPVRTPSKYRIYIGVCFPRSPSSRQRKRKQRSALASLHLRKLALILAAGNQLCDLFSECAEQISHCAADERVYYSSAEKWANWHDGCRVSLLLCFRFNFVRAQII